MKRRRPAVAEIDLVEERLAELLEGDPAYWIARRIRITEAAIVNAERRSDPKTAAVLERALATYTSAALYWRCNPRGRALEKTHQDDRGRTRSSIA